MKLLVIGSGGREHALVRTLSGRPDVSVTCAPGNAGIADDADVIPIESGAVAELEALARRESFDLTIVGPELPLDLGLVDCFALPVTVCLVPRAPPLSSSAVSRSPRTS